MEDKRKKTVTTVATMPPSTVATVQKKKKKAKCLTKALLPLQYLYSANTLNAQYRSTVAGIDAFYI